MQGMRRARKDFRAGTIRLLIIFISGFIGMAFLVIWLTEIVSGKIELSPTTVSIETIEADGFPRAAYLNVEDVCPIFPEASIANRNKDTASSYLAVPMVSHTLQKIWLESVATGKPLDASRFRLFAVFTGEQAQKMWPQGHPEPGEPGEWQQSCESISITGETGKSTYAFISKPMDSHIIKTGLNWSTVRYLKVNKHWYSLWHSINYFCYAFVLLSISGLTARFHIRNPCKAQPKTQLDPLVSHDEWFSDDSNSDTDSDGDGGDE